MTFWHFCWGGAGGSKPQNMTSDESSRMQIALMAALDPSSCQVRPFFIPRNLKTEWENETPSRIRALNHQVAPNSCGLRPYPSPDTLDYSHQNPVRIPVQSEGGGCIYKYEQHSTEFTLLLPHSRIWVPHIHPPPGFGSIN